MAEVMDAIDKIRRGGATVHILDPAP